MKFGFNVNTRYIEFELTFRRRKTMQISIKPPDIINVVAPIGITQDRILEEVKSKSNWIIKKLDYFNEIGYNDIKKKFVDGELFMYLGKNYPLKILKDENIKGVRINIEDENLCVVVKEDKENIKSAIEKWYKDNAKIQIERRVKYYQSFFNERPLAIKVKNQKHIWGSCTYQNKLLFNWKCIMARIDALDYVIVHEMCHMKHKNHSKNFWNEVARVMPNYKESQRWLKKYGIKMDI